MWDSRTISWLRTEEYRPEVVQQITASTITELSEELTEHGLEDPRLFERSVREYNEAVYESQWQDPNRLWDPAVKDGQSTQSATAALPILKSNWALPIDQGPFLAVKVSAGITFAFGGLTVNPETAGVISTLTNEAVPGLYCVGDMLGGLFYDNYRGGSGLISGAVLGRRAGQAAAAAAA